MAKKKDKPETYKCELCGKIKPWLIGFCACDECDDNLREVFEHYRTERKRLEASQLALFEKGE